MKYIKSDFWGEHLSLRWMPTTVTEAKNKLICLQETNKRRNPNYGRDRFIDRKPSKRCERLVKMYWIFKKKEAI